MDVNIIPSDILIVIFSHLDLRSIVSLGLTCRRFFMVFGSYPSSTLFGNRCQFKHTPLLSSSKAVDNYIVPGVTASLIYTGPAPSQLQHCFDGMQEEGFQRSHQRLARLITLLKTSGYILFDTESCRVDYIIDVSRSRYHVFTLSFHDNEKRYIQYHRNGQVLVKASFESSKLLSCDFFDVDNICRCSIRREESPPRYIVQSDCHQWTSGINVYTDEATAIALVMGLRPDDLPHAIMFSSISKFHLIPISLRAIEACLVAWFIVKGLYRD